MIRFIDLGKQYWGDENVASDLGFREYFAFIDTVPDQFVQVENYSFWDCWDDFAEFYEQYPWRGMELERFKGLTNPKFFREPSI